MYKGSSSLHTAVHGLIFQHEMQNRAILSSIKQRILLCSSSNASCGARRAALTQRRYPPWRHARATAGVTQLLTRLVSQDRRNTTFLLLLRLLFKRFIVTLISFPWFSTVFLPPQFFCYVGGSPFSAQTELYLYYIKVQWLIEFKVVTKHDIYQANNLSNYQQFHIKSESKM